MPDPKWLEVSLTVDPELAEAVSEVLSRFVSGGVVVESNVKYNDAEDEGTPYGPVRVYGYLAIDEQIEETRQKVAEALWYLGTHPAAARAGLPADRRRGLDGGLEAALPSHPDREAPADPAGLDRARSRARSASR